MISFSSSGWRNCSPFDETGLYQREETETVLPAALRSHVGGKGGRWTRTQLHISGGGLESGSGMVRIRWSWCADVATSREPTADCAVQRANRTFTHKQLDRTQSGRRSDCRLPRRSLVPGALDANVSVDACDASCTRGQTPRRWPRVTQHAAAACLGPGSATRAPRAASATLHWPAVTGGGHGPRSRLPFVRADLRDLHQTHTGSGGGGGGGGGGAHATTHRTDSRICVYCIVPVSIDTNWSAMPTRDRKTEMSLVARTAE